MYVSLATCERGVLGGARCVDVGAYIGNPSGAKADSRRNSPAIRGLLLAALWARKAPSPKPTGSHLFHSVFIILYGCGRERRGAFWVDGANKAPKLMGLRRASYGLQTKPGYSRKNTQLPKNAIITAIDM